MIQGLGDDGALRDRTRRARRFRGMPRYRLLELGPRVGVSNGAEHPDLLTLRPPESERKVG